MKIGILTQPLQTNYGGLLQNYALQLTLRKYGHLSETIDHEGRYSYLYCFLSKVKAYFLHILNPSKYEKPLYSPSKKEAIIIRSNTNYFINKYIVHTKPLHSIAEFHNIPNRNKYDAYIVGSDQCWRPIYNAFLEEMFLRFTEAQTNVKRIAYAASFGAETWEMNERTTKLCSKLAKKFDLVTVREDSGVRLCEKYLDIKASQVLDPTMLLDKEDYINLIESENETISQGTLFYYILDPSQEKENIVNTVASTTNLVPFTVMPTYQKENRTKKAVRNHIEQCVYPPVTTWLRGFMDAEMTIVDSFHGMVFSIIFNKPFWVIGNGKRGNSRFDSLLTLLNLEDRFIGNIKNKPINYNSQIDWTSVNNILQREKSRSIKLLCEALK